MRKVRRLELDPVRGGAPVVHHWSRVDPSLTQWWAMPAGVKRWNLLIEMPLGAVDRPRHHRG